MTVFTLSLQSNSVSGCIMTDPGMTRPVTLTVTNSSAVLLTSGGIHYDLSRVAPNVYAGGYWVKIRADLSTRPKRLTVSNDDGSCNWAATAAWMRAEDVPGATAWPARRVNYVDAGRVPSPTLAATNLRTIRLTKPSALTCRM